MRKNKNRGFQQLRVWNDAIEFYALNSRIFLNLPYSLKRDDGAWVNQIVVKEGDVAYECE